MKLFCFPYAGGSSVVYYRWRRMLAPSIELIAVELAGRGRRIQEPLYKDAEEMVEDVLSMIRPAIGSSPYALFGHSMGGMIAYRLAQKIRYRAMPGPEHVFLSGRYAPHVDRPDKKKYHLMNDSTFKRELIDLGGTPPEFFDDAQLMDLFFPMLRNDFMLAATREPDTVIRPLDCPITAFFGRQEDLSAEECEGWKMHTRKECSLYYFDGGHFFLHEEAGRIVECINRTLAITGGVIS